MQTTPCSPICRHERWLAPVLQLNAPPLRPRPKRVLIADDDAFVRASLAAVLRSEGFQVEEAEDGAQAVTLATRQAPDLVLLDLNMPRMDGWAAFTRLQCRRPLVPVIVITARPHQYEEAVRLGVDAFMEKPLNIGLLVRAARQLSAAEEDAPDRRYPYRNSGTWFLGNED